MKEKFLWAIFVVLVACGVGGGIFLWLKYPGGRDLNPAPEFRVIDRNGNTLTRSDLLGRVWVADFIFTRCPTVCPRMNTVMYGLQEKYPGVRFVSFSVDPEHDTPEHLSKWVPSMGLDKDLWTFATSETYEEMQSVARGFLLGVGREGNEITHSERFVLVDAKGKVQKTYPILRPTLERDPEELAKLESDLAWLVWMSRLPAVNCGFNATSAFLLLVGLGFIKARRVSAHKACMLGALGASTLFLVGYLTAHHYLGSTPFQGQGWIRPVYFTLLISHSILAAFIVPLALITLTQALRERFDRHRAIARWTLPLWLYVSVTGVVIYFMLYGV